MDYFYLVELNSYISDEELMPSDDCECSLSKFNILALANDCCIYALPLEKPNELLPVAMNNSSCVGLKWSDDGLFLLNVNKNGICNIFYLKNILLNLNEPVYSFQIDKCDFVLIKSFNKAAQLCVSDEKKDSVNYLDKFYYSSFAYLKNLSRVAHNGFVFLTKNGIIHICFTDFNTVKSNFGKFEFDLNLKNNNNKPSADGESMDYETGSDNDQASFDQADFTFESDGSLTLALTNQDINSPIFIYKVNLRLNNEGTGLEGSTDLTSTININFSDSTQFKSKLNFLSNESSQLLCVSLHEPLKNASQLNIYQQKHESWNLIKTIQCPSKVIEIKTAKINFNFKEIFEGANRAEKSYFVVSYENGQNGFVDMQSFNQVLNSPVPAKKENASPPKQQQQIMTKKIRYSQDYLIAFDLSYTSAIGVGLTNNRKLVTFRNPELKNSHLQNTNLSHLINLYEYCFLSGADFWDLIMCTSPKLVNQLIEILEQNFLSQTQQSMQKAYFSKFYSLIYSLSRRSLTHSQFRPFDILVKLVLNRSLGVVSFAVQSTLNIDSLVATFSSSSTTTTTTTTSTTNYINTATIPPLINTTLIMSNSDFINSQTVNNIPGNNPLANIQFKNNLNEYLADILKLDPSEYKLSLSEIVQTALNKKNMTVVVNQQLRHVNQWIVDLALNLIHAASNVYKPNQLKLEQYDVFGASLLGDSAFLNDLRRGLVNVKLLFVHAAFLSSAQQQLANNYVSASLPVLPIRSSVYQKDLLGELFNLVTKLMQKNIENQLINDENIYDHCVSILSDTIFTPMDEKLVNLRHTWFGKSSSSWSKTFEFQVDYLFEEEKFKRQYPLFDILRLIQFSRSNVTRQCIRCGNFTELNNQFNTQNSKTNCLYMQVASGDRCVCNGIWTQSPLQ